MSLIALNHALTFALSSLDAPFCNAKTVPRCQPWTRNIPDHCLFAGSAANSNRHTDGAVSSRVTVFNANSCLNIDTMASRQPDHFTKRSGHRLGAIEYRRIALDVTVAFGDADR